MRLCTCEDQSLAIVVISHARLDLLPEIVERAMAQDPDEFLVVSSCIKEAGFPFITVPPLTNTTVDALIKRDAGTVATRSQNICYLSDDHILAPDFVAVFRDRYANGEWDLLAPSRFTVRGQTIYPLNVGERERYIGGHAGVYRRDWVRQVPWTTAPHHPNWDLLHSHLLTGKGARLVYAGYDLAVEDIEPNAEPWLG